MAKTASITTDPSNPRTLMTYPPLLGVVGFGRFSLTLEFFHFGQRFVRVIEGLLAAAFAAQEHRLALNHDAHRRAHSAQAIVRLDRAKTLGFGQAAIRGAELG